MTGDSQAKPQAGNANDHLAQPAGDIDSAQDRGGASERFPIVGIGASAGGLRAFERFFSHLPDEPDMAFVLVQHLAPNHESELAELLQNYTRLKVTQVTEEIAVRPNCVYVIPPAKNLVIKNGILSLAEPEAAHGHRAPIDFFFRTLAEDQGENAVCIILSGTGSDGTQGLKAIKERTGLVMAQSTEDAEYDGMPRSAINTGLVDIFGTAQELAQKLMEYRQSARTIRMPLAEDALPEDDTQALNKLFTHLRVHTGHDFLHYKRSTILRRIARRLQINQIGTIADYAEYLRQRPEERDALFREFLISVTNFFRDPEAFGALEETIIPELFHNKSRQEKVRVWVAGCATGEEAYSLAILLHEYASTLSYAPEIQIFATDIDENALAYARAGHYPDSIATDITSRRLKLFFREESGGYRVSKQVRESILFATHNIIEDPTFSRLDLISCRNLLIYLNRSIQNKIYQLFHYALRPDGYLFLGSSESTEQAGGIFAAVDKKHHIYQRRNDVNVQPFGLMGLPRHDLRDGAKATEDRDGAQKPTLEEMYRDWTLRRYAPPRFLVDEHYNITHIFGGAERYLRPLEGQNTQHVLQRAPDAMRLELRAALFQAFQKREHVETPLLQLSTGQETQTFRLMVGPVEGDEFPDGYVEVVFVEQPGTLEHAIGDSTVRASNEQLALHLEDELQRTRARLQVSIEEYEASNEELKASNEELRSMNEELQSTTEELETSKEELQSINEELVTVNQELKIKIDELGHAYADLQNLMESTETGIIFLDAELRIKRFTPRASDLFNIIASDLGRPFSHISHKIEPPHQDISALARQVLEALQTIEKTLHTSEGHWFILGLFPYKTLDSRIEGVVLTFYDVTEMKEAEQTLHRRSAQQQAVVQLGQLALENVTLEQLFETTVHLVAEAIAVPYCKILRLQPERNKLLLVAGVGWKDGMVGHAAVTVRYESQAGYTLLSNEPVIVENLATESRFSAPALLRDHAIVSGISVVINGQDQAPYGVLGAHAPTPRSFNQDDAAFMQAVANLLAAALERKANVEALETSQETILRQFQEIQALYEAAPVGISFLDPELRYVRINQRLAEINGIPIEAHIGKRGPDLLPELEAEIVPQLQEVLKSGKPITGLEVVGYTPADPEQEHAWLVSHFPVKIGQDVIGVGSIVQDISERKAYEEAIAYQARLLDAIQDAVISVDAGLRVVSWNRAAEQLYGWTEEEAVGKNIANLVRTEYPDPGQSLEAAMQALTAQGFWRGEVVQYNRKGERLIILNSTAALRDPDGNIRGAVAVNRDIADRKAAEDMLREREVQLRTLNDTLEKRVAERTTELARTIEDLNQFTRVASHDLRSPLRSIDNLAAWLLEDVGEQLPESSLEHLNRLRSRVLRMERLLDSLLEYSRVDATPQTQEDLVIEEVVEEIVNTLNPPAGFNIVVEDTPKIRGPRATFELVLRNLLDNAIKHHDHLEGTIVVSGQLKDDVVEFSVTDDGPGIDPRFHARVFEAFQKLHSQDQREGSGMGLALVTRILEARGGTIWVESAGGRGATFRFQWPLGEDESLA